MYWRDRVDAFELLEFLRSSYNFAMPSESQPEVSLQSNHSASSGTNGGEPSGKIASTARYLPIVEACIIGAAAGLSAVALLHGIKWLGAWRVALATRYSPELVLTLFGTAGGLIAGILVKLAPEVSGSGIPQTRAMLSHINLRLNLKSAVIKLVGGVIALGCGLFLGREGPTVQVGAALAAQLSRWFPTTAQHRGQLIAAGAGAGLAAAFNAPLAGVVFVLEELLKDVSSSIVGLSLVACFSAAAVENMFGGARSHSMINHVGSVAPLQPIDVTFYVVLGLLAAFFGAVFNNSILISLKLYRKLKISVILCTTIAGLATGLIVSHMPADFHNYAAARQLINSGTVQPDMVPIAFVVFFFLVLIAYGSGAPGGLFAPSLSLGATLGYMIGFLHMHFTGVNLIDTFTQVGMGAFFAAVARVPLTSSIIVFEMSGNISLIPPLMIACVIGSTVAELLSKGSLYDSLMVWSGINLRGPGPEAKTLTVEDLMNRSPFFLDANTRVSDARAQMKPGQRGCPVVLRRRLVGVVTTAQMDSVDGESAQQRKLREIMTTNPVTVGPYDDVERILFLFTRHHFVWLPVTDDNKLIGTISRLRVMEAMFPKGGDEGWTTLTNLPSAAPPEPPTLTREEKEMTRASKVSDEEHPDMGLPQNAMAEQSASSDQTESQSASEAVAEPAAGAGAERDAEAVAVPASGAVAAPVAGAVAVSDAGAVAAPVAGAVAEPVAEPVASPVAGAVAESAAEPAARAGVGAVAESAAEPDAGAVAEPAVESVAESNSNTTAAPEQTT